MIAGTLLIYDNFKFSENVQGKKILVVLNDGSVGYYIIVKTISKAIRKNLNYGCQTQARSPCFFLSKHSCGLEKDVWVGLDEFFEFTACELLARRFSGDIKTIGVLPETVVKELLKCAISCDDILTGQLEILTAQLSRLA